MGFYSPASIVRDAQKARYGQLGVEVRPVRVEQSDWHCTLEPAAGGKPALRLGFRLLRGMGQASAEKIVAARRERATRFGSIDEFVHAVDLRRDELDRLAEAGALEGITPSRRDALWHLRAPRGDALFGGHSFEPEQPVGLAPLGAEEQLALDYRTAGLSLHDHPMRHIRRRLGRRRLRRAEEQTSFRQDATVTVAGVVISRQRPMTASGIVFVTLEDETGVLNLVVYPHVFERYELEVRHGMILLARGRVDRRGEVVHVRVSHVERLDRPGGALVVRSRDFH
jgi:error-prone DNA polymerase